MRIVTAIGCLVLTTASLGALEESPWIPQAYVPVLDLKYGYSSYRDVADASVQLDSRSHDQLAVVGLGMATLSHWAADAELEVAHTPRLPWGYRSAGAQLRKQWCDDITGDWFSLTTGALVRVVTTKPLHDVSTPYHGKFNGELNASIGREWSRGVYWCYRLYGFAGIGVANQGSPWVRGKLAYQGNFENKMQLHLFVEGYKGYGDQIHVNTKQFKGWKAYDHRSIDAGAALRFGLRSNGYLTFEFKHRLFARTYPEKVTFFTIRYTLPLSM